MRKIFIALLSALFISTAVHAAITSAAGYRISFNTSSVGVTTWVPVVSSTPKNVKALVIYNSSPSPLEVGMALGGATANTETRQLVIPGLLGSDNPISQVYSIPIGQNMRISIRALQSAATTGEAQLNFLYN